MSLYLDQFNYQLSGPEEGRAWVFLHGLMGYGSNWRKILSLLPPTERILTFDQRGHGKSFRPLTGYSPQDYAEDLYLITQDLGWERFILVGHSMGGRNALAFADRFPDKLEKLVIEDIGAESNPSAPQDYQNLFAAVPTPFPDKRSARDFFYNEFPKKGLKLNTKPEILGAYLYSNMEEKPDGTADWRFPPDAIIKSVVEGRARDQWAEVKNLRMPTLLIRGEHSNELSPEVFEKMLSLNSLIRGEVVSNAGHWVHADQPQEFVDLLRKFVDGF